MATKDGDDETKDGGNVDQEYAPSLATQEYATASVSMMPHHLTMMAGAGGRPTNSRPKAAPRPRVSKAKGECNIEGCTARPNFGKVGERPTHCLKHKEKGMADCRVRRCESEGCHRRPLYGVEQRQPRACSEHKTAEMRDVCNRHCDFEGCTRQPYYNHEGEKPAFCSAHKEPGMTDVVNKKCDAGCGKRALYGSPGSTMKFCSRHKPKECITTSYRKCQMPGCDKWPLYAFDGEKAKFCGAHKEQGMMDVRSRRCAGEDCKHQPSYALEGQKPKFCAQHKEPDMIDVVSRRCQTPGCTRRPLYAEEGEKAKLCSLHKQDHMMDVSNKRCRERGCTKRPCYGPEGEPSVCCTTHKEPGMVSSKKCASRGCKNFVVAGKADNEDGTPTKFCPLHAERNQLQNRFIPVDAEAGAGAHLYQSYYSGNHSQGSEGGGMGVFQGWARRDSFLSSPRQEPDYASMQASFNGTSSHNMYRDIGSMVMDDEQRQWAYPTLSRMGMYMNMAPAAAPEPQHHVTGGSDGSLRLELDQTASMVAQSQPQYMQAYGHRSPRFAQDVRVSQSPVMGSSSRFLYPTAAGPSPSHDNHSSSYLDTSSTGIAPTSHYEPPAPLRQSQSLPITHQPPTLESNMDDLQEHTRANSFGSQSILFRRRSLPDNVGRRPSIRDDNMFVPPSLRAEFPVGYGGTEWTEPHDAVRGGKRHHPWSMSLGSSLGLSEGGSGMPRISPSGGEHRRKRHSFAGASTSSPILQQSLSASAQLTHPLDPAAHWHATQQQPHTFPLRQDNTSYCFDGPESEQQAGSSLPVQYDEQEVSCGADLMYLGKRASISSSATGLMTPMTLGTPATSDFFGEGDAGVDRKEYEYIESLKDGDGGGAKALGRSHQRQDSFFPMG